MKDLKYKGNRVKLFDSIEDLTSKRFHVYNLNFLIDMGIGGDIQAFYKRLGVITQKIGRDDEGAKQEVRNMSATIENIIRNTSPKMRCFCALVAELNGRKITNKDLTDSGIDEMVKELNNTGILYGVVSAFVDSVKKKLKRIFQLFSPKGATKATNKDNTSK